MAITVRSTSTVTRTGGTDAFTEPAAVNLLAPAGLAIGDYYVVSFFFAAMLGTTNSITPPGFTLLSDIGTSANRQLLVFGRRMVTASDVTASATTPVRAGSTATTRVAAVGVALQGVHTTTPVGTVGTWVTGSAVSSITFPNVTGDKRFNFYYGTSSATVGSQTVTGGTVLAWALSPEGGTASASAVGVADGGTAVTFSGTAPTVSGGFSLAFTDAPPAPTFKMYYGASAITKAYRGSNQITTVKSEPNPIAPPAEGMAFTALASGFGEKKAFAHYFGPYPISVDNAALPDYWERNWTLAVPGEGGAWTYCAGWTRDRPVYRAPRAGDWEYKDALEDVTQALAGGLDGFWNNIMGTTGANQTRYNNAVLAASALKSDGSFKVLPMIDTNGSVGSASAATIADIIAFYAYSNALRGRTTANTRRASGWFLDDGRFVVGSYKADGKTAAWWQAIFDDLLAQYGISVAFVAVLSNYNNASTLNSVAWARGVWGDGADPNIATAYGDYAGQAVTAGKKWMAPVWPQDVRPENGLFDEARGTESLRKYWERAIADNADMAQICTWSDFREGATINKSVKRGMAMIDISAYFIHKWKTGNYPTIVRDGFYLSHRNQFVASGAPSRTAFAATATGAYVLGSIAANGTTGKAADGLMGHWVRPNRGSVVDIVEVLSFFTAPTDVSINVGGTVTNYTAPSGMFARTVPLGLGTITVTATRSGSPVAALTSPAQVRSAPYNQDPAYNTFSTFPTRTPAEQGQYDYQGYLLANM